MNTKSQLIVMLTNHDQTVPNAYSIFDVCKDSNAMIWGIKDQPLPFNEMKRLFTYMKSCGKSTALEVVAYTEEECIQGARTAVACGCDYLMGTVFFESANDICQKNHISYLPFVGNVSQRPSILEGTAEAMIQEAASIADKGVYGFDLLGYRYTGDAVKLNQNFVAASSLPVCIAGSVDSFAKLEEIKKISPWAFTIGSAFFEHKFGDSFKEQINAVCAFMEKP